mgnify:CR=1 FL=1
MIDRNQADYQYTNYLQNADNKIDLIRFLIADWTNYEKHIATLSGNFIISHFKIIKLWIKYVLGNLLTPFWTLHIFYSKKFN